MERNLAWVIFMNCGEYYERTVSEVNSECDHSTRLLTLGDLVLISWLNVCSVFIKQLDWHIASRCRLLELTSEKMWIYLVGNTILKWRGKHACSHHLLYAYNMSLRVSKIPLHFSNYTWHASLLLFEMINYFMLFAHSLDSVIPR